MLDRELFIDPSVLFDKRAIDGLSRYNFKSPFRLWTSEKFSKTSLNEISELDFSEMREYYGKSVEESRNVSKDVLLLKLRDIDLHYYSYRDEIMLPGILHDLDDSRMEMSYDSGWRMALDMDELWFLASHSVVLSRIKSRERDLSLSLLKLLRRGFRSFHLTVEGAPPTPEDDYRTLSNFGSWLVWILTGAAALNYISPLVPWLAAGPIIVSYKL